MAKKILFIQKLAPYASNKSQANFNLITTAAAFDFTVSIAFIGDGVFQLVLKQQAELIAQRNLAKQILGLELFDIEEIYVEKDALEKRYLLITDLIFKPKLVTQTQLHRIMEGQDFIISL